MSTVGVVAISVIFGLFLFFLLALISLQVYLTLSLRRIQADISRQMPLLIDEYRNTLTSQIGQLNAKIATIKGEEIQRAGEVIVLSARRIENAAAAFGESARTLIAMLGGEQEEESETGAESVTASGRARPPAAGIPYQVVTRTALAPEAYAPPDLSGGSYITQSRTATADAIARDKEQREQGLESGGGFEGDQ